MVLGNMKILYKYYSVLKKGKFIILVAWLIIVGFSVWIGPKFISETSSDFNVPKDTPSYIANSILQQEFPRINNETTLIVVVYSENSSTLNQEIEDFSFELRDSLLSSLYSDIIIEVNGYFYLKDIVPEAAYGYVSDSTNTTIIEINVNEQSEELVLNLINYLKNLIQEIKPTRYTVLLTGAEVLFEDMRSSAEKDIILMDSIVLPIALIVLAFVLKSFRLMILPVLSVGSSIATSFFLMYPVAKLVPVFSFVPSVMMSLVIALSIDYSLFLLSRYKEELRKGKDNFSAIKLMLEHAGHTIFVSGVTLTITFLALVFFPIGLLATIGVGAAVSIVTTLIINLTLVPVLLLIFHKFFSKSTPLEKTNKKTEKENQFSSIWYKIGKFSTKYSVIIILAVFIFAIPVSVQMIQFKTSIGENHIIPRDTDSSQAFDILKREFSPGMLGPMYIIVKTNTINGCLTPTFFTISRNLITNITAKTDITNDSFITISWGQGFVIPFFIAMSYLDPGSPTYSESNAALYRMLFDRYTNEDNSTVIIDIQPSFDPYSSYIEQWIVDAREIFDEFESNSSYNFYLAGSSTDVVDSVEMVYDMLPMIIGVIVFIVYLLIAIMFKSVLVPLRLIFTVGLTISWIYGLTALIFDVGIINWMIPLLGEINSLYWATPVMSFSILIGLTLDYDIFLLSRISEFRDKGYTERASIIKGLCKTGGIISMAGVIMAISFSGLMFSNVWVLNEFGFILTIAVILDTFVIRTILVPAIMYIAQKWNWWPSKKPVPTKDETVFE
ncbi:MAG: MMPL family transporter [Candidatus Heimdallarchaeaceae archaeon]